MQTREIPPVSVAGPAQTTLQCACKKFPDSYLEEIKWLKKFSAANEADMLITDFSQPRGTFKDWAIPAPK